MATPSAFQVLNWLKVHYSLEGQLQALNGELDANYCLQTETGNYLVKVSRPNPDLKGIDFQERLLLHLLKQPEVKTSQLISNNTGNHHVLVEDEFNENRVLRVLTWLEGRLWSSVNPITETLLFELGQAAGTLTNALHGFTHSYANRSMEWDLNEAAWTKDFLHLFDKKQRGVLEYFIDRFDAEFVARKAIRKSVVHNDINDNNILVSEDAIQPHVAAIIDFGDAVSTQSCNDAAITLAYSIMEKPNPLEAASTVLSGYHSRFPLHENEVELLYTLIGIRLVVSVTKAALNKQQEPENLYHQISVVPAWNLLKKWQAIHPDMVTASFRVACGYEATRGNYELRKFLQKSAISICEMFPEYTYTSTYTIDLGVGSTWLGSSKEYDDLDALAFKIRRLQADHSDSFLAGGYMEVRPFYSTDAYRSEGNQGPEYRSVHLGTDFWLPAGSAIHAPLAGKVITATDNNYLKDYGPTILLEHQTDDGIIFYSLYGHLSRGSLETTSVGDRIEKGQCFAHLGGPEENGTWVPHLHFQLFSSVLGNVDNYPGVCAPNSAGFWQSICPDPALLFKELETNRYHLDGNELLTYRREHLGKSLSLSYSQPLQMVRGEGPWLIDHTGRKYLDTVNNVAHVGHENPTVVAAGSAQMALLNTNTRYLHASINELAEELLSTFPQELSVVHFVNSGSEANELALRMARAATGQRDIIALEMGYHGNTAACIDISSYKFNGKGGAGQPEYTSIVPLPDAFRGLHRGEHCGIQYAEYVQDELERIQAKGRNVAAFICESIVSCGGQIELPENYLRAAYSFVRAAGGVCIADEVQVGCGRVGSAFWGFQLHKVVPDIVTIGKPLGNGHPLAAVVCTRAIAEAFANGMEYFNTFGGNPVSCAVGKAVLQTVKNQKLQEAALATGNYLKQELSKLSKDFPIIADVRGQGLFLGIELTDASLNPLPSQTYYLANRMRDLGILMSTDGKENNVLKIKPPLVFDRIHADELLLRLRQILQEDFMSL